MKVERVNSIGGELFGYEFQCPGCGNTHMLPTAPGAKPCWGFNGDVDHPTFTPSILAKGNKLELDDQGEWTGEYKRDAQGQPIPYVCHSFVRQGLIEFLSDCTHEHAGKTLPLKEIPPC